MRRLNSIRGALLVATVLLAPASWHAPLHAEKAAEAPADPYQDLYAAMDAVTGSEQEFERQFALAMDRMRQTPKYQEMDQREPGVVDAIVAAMRPWMKKQTDRLEQRTRPRYIALMKEVLTPDDARKLAAYCRTERGQRFLLAQMDPERFQPSEPSKPLGEPTAFLKPATGHTPPKPKPAPETAPSAQEPAVAALLSDPELQARVTAFFARSDAMMFELAQTDLDKDIEQGMVQAVDYAASSYGYRLYDKPIS